MSKLLSKEQYKALRDNMKIIETDINQHNKFEDKCVEVRINSYNLDGTIRPPCIVAFTENYGEPRAAVSIDLKSILIWAKRNMPEFFEEAIASDNPEID